MKSYRIRAQICAFPLHHPMSRRGPDHVAIAEAVRTSAAIVSTTSAAFAWNVRGVRVYRDSIGRAGDCVVVDAETIVGAHMLDVALQDAENRGTMDLAVEMVQA